MNIKYSVGIDMAKDDFKACIALINKEQKVTIKSSGTFTNSPAGFKNCIVWVDKHCKEDIPVCYLMEATGSYHEQLAWTLFSKGKKVSVILPNKAKRYFQSLGVKSKNDKIDAQGLARMCAEQNINLWQPLSENLYQLRSLTRLHETLNQQKTDTSNRLHAIKYSMYELKEVGKLLNQSLTLINKQLKEIEAEIKKLIMDDPLLKDKYKKISKIKGVGLLTFSVIIAETNGFTLFENIRQLVSYAGYDVIENQSGTITKKTRISKKGNPHIRRSMHMAALTSVKYEPKFKALYERVFDRTKIKMKGCVAVQRKMLTLIYSLWKKDVSYEQGYQNTSGIQEDKLLFSVDSGGIAYSEVNKNSLTDEAALDENLPYKQSDEVLFSVKQSY